MEQKNYLPTTAQLCYNKKQKEDISMERQVKQMFLLLGGGLLIILFAVIVAVVSSVVSAVAAVESDSED